MTPQEMCEAGSLLTQLGNWMGRTYPQVTVPGAQAGEDAILAELLRGSQGTYVDVGASHPIECSNTWQFYRQSWRGLLIEPLRDPWPAILKHRPGDHLWPQAASNYTGYGRLRMHGTVSSLRADWAIQEQATALCEVDTLANILERFPAIRDNCRLCSIDVEGEEKAVLEGIDFSTFHPEVFVVEWLVYGKQPPDDDRSAAWRPILEGHGYKQVHKTGLNYIFQKG
jgi:FkbM family methyltransferase